MASGCVRGGLDWILEKISLVKGIGVSCPGKWWSHHPWRCSEDMALQDMV